MKLRLGTWIFVGALLTFATPARADDSADAKTHYQKATAHYAVGEYHDAAMEYEAAYKAKQDPALLYNAAQSHRLAGDNPKALLLYKNIVKLYPTSKYAGESKDRIDKLEQAIATTTSPPNQPATAEPGGPAATATPPGASPPLQPIGAPPVNASAPAAPVPAAPPPSAIVTATATPDAGGETPIYKKWWFWGGAGVVVLAAIVVIAAASSSTTPWANVSTVNGKVR